jgi:hypothetical protein
MDTIANMPTTKREAQQIQRQHQVFFSLHALLFMLWTGNAAVMSFVLNDSLFHYGQAVPQATSDTSSHAHDAHGHGDCGHSHDHHGHSHS